MIPWKLLDSAPVPGGSGELRLYRRAGELSIRVNGVELMNSRAHASEGAFAALGCERIAGRPAARVLVGGLGMGFSLRTALGALRADAQVVVAELVPAVVRWNRDYLGELADHPLRDPRVTVQEQDVGVLIRGASDEFDAILLDVDNGPGALTRRANQALYSRAGLAAARAALRSGGVLGVWSGSPDPAFTDRLREADFEVEQIALRGRGAGKGARYTVWLGVCRA